jgi:hypothetical protein
MRRRLMRSGVNFKLEVSKNKHGNPKIAYPPLLSVAPQQAAGYSAIFKTDFRLLLAESLQATEY